MVKNKLILFICFFIITLSLLGCTKEINSETKDVSKSKVIILNEYKLPILCGKPTPSGVGWIALINSKCIKLLNTYTNKSMIELWKINIEAQRPQYH